MNLPLPAAQFDLVTAAFGFRNLVNYDRGLGEIYRVLASDGEIGILDFGEPKGLIGAVYRVYFRHVLPAIGTVISGVRGPYAYLAEIGAAVSSSRRDAATHAGGWLSRSFLDSLHLRNCRPVPRQEITLSLLQTQLRHARYDCAKLSRSASSTE